MMQQRCRNRDAELDGFELWSDLFLRLHSQVWQLQRIIKQYQSYQSVYSEMLAEFHFQLHQENYIHVHVAVQVWPKFNQHFWKWRGKNSWTVCVDPQFSKWNPRLVHFKEEEDSLYLIHKIFKNSPSYENLW